ncbi:Nuclease-related domain-containing protein [Alteromonadaceae bacterium Bs31]|nr:Nuclease-related domain-containing protein [Alteromonadaceae bacterium Bs31]
MAKLIPVIDVNEIDLKPERDVARELINQLPNNVTVLHSYPWLRADRNDKTGKVTLNEGEADFLIIWPEMGVLVVEVKGGPIEYDADTRIWNRVLNKYKKEIKDPFEQARKNSHRIIDMVGDKVYGGSQPPFPYGYAVFFPDCNYTGSLPPGADAAITLSSLDLTSASEKIAKALRYWSRTQSPYALSKDELSKVQRAILPAFNILPSLFRTIEEQEEKLVRLTDEQIRLLTFLGTNKRVAVEGVAGSGKTMLAKAQAERFALSGKKTLLVCYNKELAIWLKDSIPKDIENLITVFHFHGLCSHLCRSAGIRFSPPNHNEDMFWREDAANLLWEAVELLPDRFDSIVIDEAQDFCPDWWQPLELLNTEQENGYLYVFYDPAQNLYNKGNITIPALGEPFHLPTNCRNTKSISGTCSKILATEIATHPQAPLGAITEVILEKKYKTPALLDSWVKKWISIDKLSCSQIVILSPSKLNRSCINGNKVGGCQLTLDTAEWRKGDGILFSTIRSFKGLEADIVIVIDVVEPGTIDNFSTADFYVACSRAKHLLKIVSEKEISTCLVETNI